MNDLRPQYHLLIVDDDAEIRTLLSGHLGGAGFLVSTAPDGTGMRKVLDAADVHLVILDLNLPREDGFSLCRELRAKSGPPVVMLSARTDPVDRIVGLEVGADDYLTKPFDPRELIARVRNLLRRTGSACSPSDPGCGGVVSLGDWEFDLGRRHLVHRSGLVASLSGIEYRLLRAFVAQPNRVLSRQYLVAQGSGKPFSSQQRAIELQIGRLRRKLGDDRAASPLIKTVRNEGYVLASAVTVPGT